ncbi:hypothetical protein [Olivibacter jilunii]|uniref:hypothetical protein n=1 Tax=Olivibacter jilunii TaxID=985016 RepID=UPI0010311439|nr:hypothetical protein [Olivibacter jilunii]
MNNIEDVTHKNRIIADNLIIMKYIQLTLVSAIFILASSCKQAKMIDNGNSARVTVNREMTESESSTVQGTILEASTGDRLKISDIWIGDRRVPCDSNGYFHAELQPGKYKLEARAMGFENLKYGLSAKKGEVYNFSFYLKPYRDKKEYKQIH